ncbi:MAG: sensor histidine kinase [Micromonosporaceae bacterium]
MISSAGAAPTGDPVCASARSESSFLERSGRWWHIGYAIVVLAVAALWLLTPDASPAERSTGLGLLGVIVLAYLLVGRHLYHREPGLRAYTYVLLVCAATVTLVTLDGFNHFLLFIAFPHIWMMLPLRSAIGFSVGLTGVLVILPFLQKGWTPQAVAGSAITGALSVGMGVLFGLWVTGIIRESERRKALIAQLERTRAELADSHHREGVLAERERVATEIHDTLAQGFMSILMLAQGSPDAERLARIERTARENLAEARSLIEALGPDELRSGTLADACRRIVERLTAESDVQASFELRGRPVTLAANSEVVLLRATQEALNNVVKHAGAGTVRVRLDYDGAGAALTVTDDGCGFDPDTAEGYGLRGMHNRVDQVDGRLEIRSRPGHGTTVEVVVP